MNLCTSLVSKNHACVNTSVAFKILGYCVSFNLESHCFTNNFLQHLDREWWLRRGNHHLYTLFHSSRCLFVNLIISHIFIRLKYLCRFINSKFYAHPVAQFISSFDIIVVVRILQQKYDKYLFSVLVSRCLYLRLANLSYISLSLIKNSRGLNSGYSDFMSSSPKINLSSKVLLTCWSSIIFRSFCVSSDHLCFSWFKVRDLARSLTTNQSLPKEVLMLASLVMSCTLSTIFNKSSLVSTDTNSLDISYQITSNE